MQWGLRAWPTGTGAERAWVGGQWQGQDEEETPEHGPLRRAPSSGPKPDSRDRTRVTAQRPPALLPAQSHGVWGLTAAAPAAEDTARAEQDCWAPPHRRGGGRGEGRGPGGGAGPGARWTVRFTVPRGPGRPSWQRLPGGHPPLWSQTPARRGGSRGGASGVGPTVRNSLPGGPGRPRVLPWGALPGRQQTLH
uniref:Uncharacterized protein n=1 Tax=Pipistrellus kuhlii TaxID=59472 RepID=A0A7J7XAU8_PIPKU|nr:hypothetical protein mPipKuh1_010569 [Pipistrellus kuhlii]